MELEQKKFKKSLGQYFLRCSWVLKALVLAGGITKKDIVLEIGPGKGALTFALADKAGRIIAVEKDESLAGELQENLKKEGIKNVEIIAGDILKLLTTNQLPVDGNYKVVANIPYYLTSRLFRLLLEGEYGPELIVLTIQKEVAERILAEPPRMNLLALGVKTHGNPKIMGSIPPSCFWPKPKVSSAIIQISDISSDFFEKNHVNEKRFFELAKAGFSQKRKTIANSLAKISGSKDRAIKIIKKSGLDPSKRPEELSINDWLKIYKNWLI